MPAPFWIFVISMASKVLLLLVVLLCLCSSQEQVPQSKQVKNINEGSDFTEVLTFSSPRSLDECFDLGKPPTPKGRASYALTPRDEAFGLVSELRNYVTRCLRGLPYNEWALLQPDMSPSVYLSSVHEGAKKLYPQYLEQVTEIKSLQQPGSKTKISSIDDPSLPPYLMHGRGNFYFVTIFQLEHNVEQVRECRMQSLVDICYLTTMSILHSSLVAARVPRV